MIHFYNLSEIHFTIDAWTFKKKVTKKRLELKTSYLIKQLLTKWTSEKHMVLFRRMIGGVVVFVVVVEDDLEECAPDLTEMVVSWGKRNLFE